MRSHLLTAVPGIDVPPDLAAVSILRRYWDRTLPVKPEAIAAALGVSVVPRGGPREPGYEFSGYFEMRGKTPIIEFNMMDPTVRRRFTVAHELGHYTLGHRNAPRDSPSNFGASIGDPLEREANQFAAELLMPADTLRTLVNSGRMESVDQLARVFLVSKVAMGYRLTNLGLEP